MCDLDEKSASSRRRLRELQEIFCADTCRWLQLAADCDTANSGTRQSKPRGVSEKSILVPIGLVDSRWVPIAPGAVRCLRELSGVIGSRSGVHRELSGTRNHGKNMWKDVEGCGRTWKRGAEGE